MSELIEVKEEFIKYCLDEYYKYRPELPAWIIRSLDLVIKRLDDKKQRLLELKHKHNSFRESIIIEMRISESTYYRYQADIYEKAALGLGLTKKAS